MRYIAFFLTFALVITGSSTQILRAQTDLARISPNNRTFALYGIIPAFATGASSALNSTLLQNGYPRIPRGNVNWGLGGQYRWNRLILGVDLLASYQTRRREETGSRLTRLALTTNLYTGFYVYQKSWFAVYPYVGLSATDALVYLSKPTAPASVGGLLASPGNTVQLSHFSGGLVVGVGVDLANANTPNSVFESLKIGYRISPDGAHPWESRFTAVSSAPMDRFNYWFFQLNLGTAWHWRRGAP